MTGCYNPNCRGTTDYACRGCSKIGGRVVDQCGTTDSDWCEFRSKKQPTKPKRRIAPTRLKPRHDMSSEFPQGDWDEPVYHDAFTDSGTEPCSDLRQEMREDSSRIQRELMSRRNQLGVKRKGK